MELTFKKELPIIGIVLTPFVYLALIWKSLPEKVPVHWNIDGQIDDWGNKSFLILLVFMLPVLMYIITLVAEKIDPKKKIALMGSKFYQLKFFMVLVMSLISLFFIYITKNQNFSSPNLIYVLVGVLLMVLGNYFKVIQPNYFIGIRTPWTLENREVWKATHVLAGKLWFIGGLAIVLGGLIFPGFTFARAFIGIGVSVAFIPIVYSYFKFRSLEKNNIS